MYSNQSVHPQQPYGGYQGQGMNMGMGYQQPMEMMQPGQPYPQPGSGGYHIQPQSTVITNQLQPGYHVPPQGQITEQPKPHVDKPVFNTDPVKAKCDKCKLEVRL